LEVTSARNFIFDDVKHSLWFNPTLTIGISLEN
jgi:hypothetical protein